MSSTRDRLITVLQNKPYGYSSYEDFADYLIANDVTVRNEWISTKDKLPIHGDLVLVIADGKEGNVTLIDAYQLANYYEIDGFSLCEFPEIDNLTIKYWMPLPEPPKGE